MNCSGLCTLCFAPCFRGKSVNNKDVQTSIPESKEAQTVESKTVTQEETGLSVPSAEYVVTKNIFGKEKVRRVR